MKLEFDIVSVQQKTFSQNGTFELTQYLKSNMQPLFIVSNGAETLGIFTDKMYAEAFFEILNPKEEIK